MANYRGYEYARDCIHLKACRRLSKIAIDNNKRFTRGCNENCSAYISGEQGAYCTVDDAWRVAVDRYDGDRDPYDAYAHCDFPSYTLAEILEQEDE